jgi:hypothetical protein
MPFVSCATTQNSYRNMRMLYLFQIPCHQPTQFLRGSYPESFVLVPHTSLVYNDVLSSPTHRLYTRFYSTHHIHTHHTIYTYIHSVIYLSVTSTSYTLLYSDHKYSCYKSTQYSCILHTCYLSHTYTHPTHAYLS